MTAKPPPAAQQNGVLKQIDDLHRMSTAQLRQRWTDLLGTEPDRLSRNYLLRRLAYRIQELSYGGPSREVRKRLAASTRDTATKSPKRRTANLQPGTRLLRDWHGEKYEVIVQEHGFLYDGKHYRSLSAVARAITGSYWSGNRFFGLAQSSRTKQKPK